MKQAMAVSSSTLCRTVLLHFPIMIQSYHRLVRPYTLDVLVFGQLDGEIIVPSRNTIAWVLIR